METADLSTAAALDLWQAAEGLAPVDRALALAGAAGKHPDELATVPLGRRDARVLALHQALVGPMLDATAACPACDGQAEFEVDAEVLLAQEPATPAPLEAVGHIAEWRPIDSSDVAAAATALDAAAAERILLGRCVLSARGPDGDVEAPALPAEVRADLSRALLAADPLAEVLVEVTCPVCETVFVADVDVAEFVWAEVRAYAERLLGEVNVLARAYGWTEAEILGLDARRRAAYLELAHEELG